MHRGNHLHDCDEDIDRADGDYDVYAGVHLHGHRLTVTDSKGTDAATHRTAIVL